MEKSCENCRFCEDLDEGTCVLNKDTKADCSSHEFSCYECGSMADYSYEGNAYCQECLFGKFDIEETIETHYMLEGEYLGSDADIEEVIEKLDGDIELI